MPTSGERARATAVVAEWTDQWREIIQEIAPDMARLRPVSAKIAMREERVMSSLRASREYEARREMLVMHKPFSEVDELHADVEVLQDLARQCREGIAMAESVLPA